MQEKNYYIIGDVHGYCDKLMRPEDDAYYLWLENGGDATLASYGLENYTARIDTGPYLYGALSALAVPSLKVIETL